MKSSLQKKEKIKGGQTGCFVVEWAGNFGNLADMTDKCRPGNTQKTARKQEVAMPGYGDDYGDEFGRKGGEFRDGDGGTGTDLAGCLGKSSAILKEMFRLSPEPLSGWKALCPPVAGQGTKPGGLRLPPPRPLYPSYWSVREKADRDRPGGDYIPLGPGPQETAGQSAEQVRAAWWQWVWTALVEPQPWVMDTDELLTAWEERWIEFPELYGMLRQTLAAPAGPAPPEPGRN